MKIHRFALTCIGLALAATAAVGQKASYTDKDLNPIYDGLPIGKLNLLMRESPSNLKKVYAQKPVAPVVGQDTVLVAYETAQYFAKLINSMHWALVPQELPADYAVPKPAITDSSLLRVINSAEYNMVRIPADTATGCKGFLIGQTEVTQKLWVAVMSSNPSVWTRVESGWPSFDRPVENVSWQDVNQFIKKLNKLTGHRFRLPTSREWQYAANACSDTMRTLYAGSDKIHDVAWCKQNYIIGAGTKDVAQKQPNQIGLYDMSGNVWEWTADHFSRNRTKYATAMGGAANSLSVECHYDSKCVLTTNTKSQFIGFRLVEDE